NDPSHMLLRRRFDPDSPTGREQVTISLSLRHDTPGSGDDDTLSPGSHGGLQSLPLIAPVRRLPQHDMDLPGIHATQLFDRVVQRAEAPPQLPREQGPERRFTGAAQADQSDTRGSQGHRIFLHEVSLQQLASRLQLLIRKTRQKLDTESEVSPLHVRLA